MSGGKCKQSINQYHMKSLISVIIPIYKAEDSLKKCVDSVLNQTYTNLEIILVDDGSPDKCPQMCDEYARTDERVKVIHKLNGGVCDARNAGMNAAKGEWFTFAESDDYLTPDACEVLYNETVADSVDFVLGAYYKESSKGRTVKHLFFQDKIVFDEIETRNILMKKVLGLTGEELRHPEQIDSLLTCTSKLFRLDIVKNNKIEWISRKETYSDCLDFIFRYCYYSKKAVYIDKPLYHYVRTNAVSQTAVYRENTINLWMAQFEQLKRFIKEKNIESIMEEAYFNRICFSVIPIGGNAYRMRSYKLAMKEVDEMFKKIIYQEAFSRFKLNYLPFHWKVFFFTAKHKLNLSFYFITVVMRKIMNKGRNI